MSKINPQLQKPKQLSAGNKATTANNPKNKTTGQGKNGAKPIAKGNKSTGAGKSSFSTLIATAKKALTKKLYQTASSSLEELLKKVKEMEKESAEGTGTKKEAGADAKKQNQKPNNEPAKDKQGLQKSSKANGKQPVALPHGKNMHLIPVKGEAFSSPAKNKNIKEKTFKNHEETALHQEQQKIKATKAINQKRIFHTRQA